MKIQYIITIAISISTLGLVNAKGIKNSTDSESMDKVETKIISKISTKTSIEQQSMKVIDEEIERFTTKEKFNFEQQAFVLNTNLKMIQSTNHIQNLFLTYPLKSTIPQIEYSKQYNSISTYTSKQTIMENAKKEKSQSALNLNKSYNTLNFTHYKNLSSNNLNNILNTDNYANKIVFIETISDLVAKGKGLLVFNIN